MVDALLVIVGAIFVIAGIAVAVNVAGAADRLARHNPGDRQSAHGDPSSTPPESHFAMRLWGVARVFLGLLCVALRFFV